MHRAVASLGILGLIYACNVLAADQSSQKPGQKKEQPKAKNASASLTGCVDEDEGQYILIDVRSRAPIANLEAEGFPTESFAKHLGHKVTVRGTSNPGAGRPLFRVRSIESVSESCEPQALE